MKRIRAVLDDGTEEVIDAPDRVVAHVGDGWFGPRHNGPYRTAREAGRPAYTVKEVL